MKEIWKEAPFPSLEGVSLKDALLETIVSAHYLSLQLRMLCGARGFAGAVETSLLADALSRWARLADAAWCDDGPNEQAFGSAGEPR